MSDPVNAPSGNETPANQSSPKSAETTNTDHNQRLFDTAYAKGIDKGKAALLDELGIDNLDNLKSAIQFAQQKQDEEKSVADKLAEITSKYQTVEAELKTFRDVAKAEATSLFESLSEENQAAITAAGLPIEKMVPVMRKLSTANPSTPKSVGASVNPQQTNELIGEYKRKNGLDPEYKKDPIGYFNKKLAEYNERHRGE